MTTSSIQAQARELSVLIAASHVRDHVGPDVDAAEVRDRAEAIYAEVRDRAEAIYALNEARDAMGLPLLSGDRYLRMSAPALRQVLLALTEAPVRLDA